MNTKEWHTSKAAVSLKAVVINKEGKILILQRPKNDYSRPSGFDLVGGGLDQYEDPIEGIKREIKEETNLEVKDIKPIDITSFKEKDGCFTIMIGFVAQAISNEIKLSKEHTIYNWFTPEETLSIDIPQVYKNFIKQRPNNR